MILYVQYYTVKHKIIMPFSISFYSHIKQNRFQKITEDTVRENTFYS